jgi:uncharacterized membrane protein
VNPGEQIDHARGNPRPRVGFLQDFRRFFVRGLAALLPTLITLWVLIKVWDFLWENLGRVMVWVVKWAWLTFGHGFPPAAYISRYWSEDKLQTRVVGVGLAILLVYVLGVFVGNFIGRQLYRLAEMTVMRIPLVRAIYPAVKQVTDFLLAERSGQFQTSRVVAVEPHAKGVWSIGLVTGASGVRQLTDSLGQEMVTIFIPSSPTAFSGYVVVVPKETVIDLPLSVEEAMRLLISGGVLSPKASEPETLPVGRQDIPNALENSPAVSVPPDPSPASASRSGLGAA